MGKCTHCNNTGSLSKDIFRDLDCVHCDVALERVQLEGWLDHQGIQISAPEAWLIYSAGKTAAFEKAANLCESLSESSWEAPDGEMRRKEPTQEDCAEAIRSLK